MTKQMTNEMTYKIINALTLVGNQTGARILDENKLYFDRGNAHIGFDKQKNHDDCLHWCIAPGVLDALARMTLAVIHNRSH